jgi:Glyoxalase-like domain
MASAPGLAGGCFSVPGVAEMSASLLAVVVDCRDPSRQAEFRARALAYEVSQRNPDEFQVSDLAGGGTSLYFMKVPGPRRARTGCTWTW